MIWLKQSMPGSKVPLAMFCPLMRKTLDTMQHKRSCWNSNLFTHLENSVSVQTCKYQIWASRKHWLEKIFKYLYFTAQMYKVLASGKALDCLIWCLIMRSIRKLTYVWTFDFFHIFRLFELEFQHVWIFGLFCSSFYFLLFSRLLIWAWH